MRSHGRPRVRWVLVALALLPLAEIAAVIAVARLSSGWTALVLLVVLSAFGVLVLRRQGRQAWRELNLAAAAGRPPSVDLLDRALVLLGGWLLVVPGLVTGLLGLTCVLPPTRGPLRRALRWWLARQLVRAPGSVVGWVWRRDRVVRGEVLDGEVLEGEVVEDEDQDGGHRA